MRRHPLTIAQLVSRPPSERNIGPFVLLHQLGQGGFAPVWAARETYNGTEVRDAAVKLFVLGRQSNSARDRLVREARALCRVDHPHVVRFYSLVIDEPSGVGALAMELVSGQSLGARIKESGPLSPADVLRIGTAVARALTEVHRAGLLHRDVKPDNVVAADGTYKLIDFGIALPTEDEDEPAPTDDQEQTAKIRSRVAGTPGFVAPEYFQDEPPSVAGELYALGATLYMCLVGYPPAATKNDFPWDLDPNILEGRLPAPLLMTRRPALPGPLVELIERLISSNPHLRPPSASWVADRFEAMGKDASRRTRVLPPEDVGPFRGLARFEAEDRDVFFGRDGEIGSVLELLRRRNLVVLVGPSGSGKSSLARAGILPRISEGALEQWPKQWDTLIVAPGPDPRASILKSISTWLGRDIPADIECVVEALDDHVQTTGHGLLLFVDPLEELVTLEQEATGESRPFFIELLMALAESGLEGVKVLGAARRDLLDSLLALPHLGKLLARSIVLVEPLPPPALRDVLLQALDAYGYVLEDEGLADELLAGVDPSANAMPLVAFALEEAWRKRDTQSKCLTRAGLWEMGGVRGALEKHAEGTLQRFVAGDSGKRDAARRILLALTTLDGTRVVKSLDKLRLVGGKSTDKFVQTFVEARLFVPVEGGVTLAHEAVIVQWKQLETWMAAARPTRLVVAELERAARFWKTDPEVAPLIRGARLERMQKEVHAAEGEWLSDDAWGYLTASLRAARKRRLWVRSAMVLVGLTLVAGTTGWWWTNGLVPPAQVERVLQSVESTESTPSTERVEAPKSTGVEAAAGATFVTAQGAPSTTAPDMMPTMPARTLESTKRVPVRNEVPRAPTSTEAPRLVSEEKPVQAEEKPPVMLLPQPSATATSVPESANMPAKRKTRFRLNRPD